MSDQPERCITCGGLVRVVTGGEGTSHYEPLGAVVAMAVLLSDRVLDGVLDFLLVRATIPATETRSVDTSVENLARWDLKAALVECLGREPARAALEEQQ